MSLQTFGITKSFGAVRVLDGVELDVPTGSLTALLGPSGCGKTTLLRTIAGFEIPERGRIVLAGNDVTRVRLGARDIGFVFQSYALFPHLDVRANIAFGLSVRGTPAAVRTARVDALLELVKLPGYARRMPHELSGGQRQRVALARALATNPTYLLLDEPFAALDATVRKDLRRWLRALHDETHVTTILVTHDADEAMEIADRIVLMRDGRVEQSGSPASLYAEPQSPFAMRFLGDTNEIASDSDRIFVRPHDVRLEGISDGPHDATALDARAERIVDYGSRLHVELRFDDGRTVTAEIPEAEFRDLAVVVGSTYRLRFVRSRTFAQSDEMEISA